MFKFQVLDVNTLGSRYSHLKGKGRISKALLKWILSFFVYLYHQSTPNQIKAANFWQPAFLFILKTYSISYISSSRIFYDSATVKATVDPCLQNWFVLRGKPLWSFDRMDTGQKYVKVCTLAQRTKCYGAGWEFLSYFLLLYQFSLCIVTILCDTNQSSLAKSLQHKQSRE